MKLFKTKISLIVALGIGSLIAGGVSGSGRHPVQNEMDKLIASDGIANDNFGVSVSISGNYAIVGADLHDQKGDKSGAAYVFEYSAGTWAEKKLTASNGQANDHFGRSVSVSGNYAIVGAWGEDTLGSESGAAYIFERSGGGNWVQKKNLAASDGSAGQHFGFSVSISGTVAVIGAYLDDQNGTGSGAAYVFERNVSGIWNFKSKLTPSDGDTGQHFGYSVSVSGDYILVGAPFDSVGIGEKAGSAYVFKWDGSQWVEHKLTASDGEEGDFFGGSVSINGSSPVRAIVGADQDDDNGSSSGSAYLYEWSGSAWTQTKMNASDAAHGDHFGSSVGISGDFAIVGAELDDDNGIGSGSAYVFTWDGTSWTESKVRATDGEEGDRFGTSVAISPLYAIAIIGADDDDNANGFEAGSAYACHNPFDDRYFIFMADTHVRVGSTDDWDDMLAEILTFSPPPEFVLCAGDLVSWGAGSSGEDNYYNAFLASPSLKKQSGEHYIYDLQHDIPIFFCPGNHDYRYWWQFAPPYTLNNYKSYIHSNTYYSKRIGSNYAIFSLDSGFDLPVDGYPLPEGSGPSEQDLDELADSLDALDNVDNGLDSSSYTKIIMMHHPHYNPEGYGMFDGECFLMNQPKFTQICRDYGVQYVIYGHVHPDKCLENDLDGGKWAPGETRCMIPPEAKHGKFECQSLDDDCHWSVSLWPVIDLDVSGDVEAYVLDQDDNRTGRVSGNIAEFNIPGSHYERFVVNVDNPVVLHDTLTEISVHKTWLYDYRFMIEALSEGEISIRVRELLDYGSSVTAYYDDIPMYYVESPSPIGSIAKLSADWGVVDYTLRIDDPDGTSREIQPTNWPADKEIMEYIPQPPKYAGAPVDTFLLGMFAFDGLNCANEGWTSVDISHRNNFAGLMRGNTLIMEDPCFDNPTCMWTFINGSDETYDCGGFPGQLAVPKESYGKYIYNEIWSPPIIWTGSGSEAVLQFDVYRDLALDNLVFYVWHVRSFIDDIPGQWRDRGFRYYGGGKNWITHKEPIGDLLEPGTSSIQVALGVVDMAGFWGGIFGTGDCHSHSPIFDNVKIYRINTTGVQWTIRDIDLFNDTFPENGYPSGTGRIDAAIDIAPKAGSTLRPGDSASVLCADPISGIYNPEEKTGFGSAVYFYLHRNPISKPMPYNKIVEDSFRWPFVDSVNCDGRMWYLFRMDTCFTELDGPRTNPIKDKWCIDINDHYFTSGDTLSFFFGAKNTVNEWSYWNQTAGKVNSINLACKAPMEMQILPGKGNANGGDILYVNYHGSGGADQYFNTAFQLMGIYEQVDRFDRRGFSSFSGVDLGYHVRSVFGQLIPTYRKIIWNSGDLSFGTVGDGTSGKVDDFEILYTFLNQHTDDQGAGIYLSGDDMAEEWSSMVSTSSQMFIDLYIPHILVTGNHTVAHSTSPLVIGQNGSIFDRGVPLEEDTLVAYAGCPAIGDLDQISPLGSSTLEMTYEGTGLGLDGAVIANTTSNYFGNAVSVVLSGFSYHNIRDDRPAGIPDRAEHLTSIIRYLGNVLSDPTSVEAAPRFTNSLAQNYPNPFNPTTTIEYSIKESAHVSLRIYNVAGQLVKTLVNDHQIPRIEKYRVTWDCRNNAGQEVSSGVYFYKLVTKNFTKAKKLVVIK